MSDKKFTDSLISTVAAAQLLNISVSTVKRYVDRGLLHAFKTAGGHRRVSRIAVLQLLRTGLPTEDFAGALPTETVATPGEPLAHRPADLLAELTRLLITGDEPALRTLFATLRSNLPGMAPLADKFLAPAFEEVGLQWQKAVIDIYQEHRAAQLISALIAECRPTYSAMTPSSFQPLAIGGAVESVTGGIASSCIELMLLELGWRVQNLGPNTPIASFRQALVDQKPDLLWISFPYLPAKRQAVFDSCKLLFKNCRTFGCAVAVGGLAMSADLAQSLGATFYGSNLSDFEQYCRQLVPSPEAPKRGRPVGSRNNPHSELK